MIPSVADVESATAITDAAAQISNTMTVAELLGQCIPVAVVQTAS